MPNAHGKIIANVERLHRLMDEEGVSAIVARSGKNFTYLAGFAYPGTLARHLEFPDSPREVLLVWPRTGEPVMVLNSYAAPWPVATHGWSASRSTTTTPNPPTSGPPTY